MSSKRKAVIITGPGFQDEEYVYPYYRFQEAGFEVDVATKDGTDVIGKYGVPARATMATEQLNPENYDLVYLPGGHEAPDRVRMDDHVLRFVRGMDEVKKPIAVICHGPWICISAKIVKGRRITGYQAIKDDLINAGAIYEDKNVVEDGNIVSAPHYKHNGEFMRAVLKHFQD